MPRVRSNSMNGFIEGGAYGGQRGSTWYGGHKPYNKLADITGKNQAGLFGQGVTSPSQLWVFVDEHPDSINDGWNIMNPTMMAAGLTFLPVIITEAVVMRSPITTLKLKYGRTKSPGQNRYANRLVTAFQTQVSVGDTTITGGSLSDLHRSSRSLPI